MTAHPCSGPTRRTILAATGGAALLTACGGGSSASGPTASSAPDDPVVTDLATLREAGALGFETPDGKAIAVARGDDVVAWSSTCTHNGCTVGWDAETEQLLCPCHGSRFDPADGKVLQGPARRPLPAVAVSVDEAAGVLKRG